MEKIQIASDNNVLNEKLLKAENFSKSFRCLIIAKKKNLINTTLNFDFNSKILNFSTEDGINIEIKFNDILALIPFKQKEEEEIKLLIKKDKPENNIRVNSLNEDKSKNSLENDEFLFSKNSSMANLNFFPNYSVRKCNCCGWLCCNCRETVTERRAKVNLNYSYVFLFLYYSKISFKI